MLRHHLGLLCLIPKVDEAMRTGLAFVNLGTKTNDKWFCSELVLAGYAAADVPLTKNPPHWTAPGEIIPLISNGNLQYVGHLKTR